MLYTRQQLRDIIASVGIRHPRIPFDRLDPDEIIDALVANGIVVLDEED